MRRDLIRCYRGGHGHFIPWDDDLDLCVFEKDFDRAIECLTHLSDDAVLQYAGSEPNYYHDWVKVVDQRSRCYPGNPFYKEHGVWIDIYKLIKAKAQEAQYKIAEGVLKYYRKRLDIGTLTKGEYQERIRKGKWLEKLELKDDISSDVAGKDAYIVWSAAKIILDEDWVEPLRTVSFEGLEVTTFAHAERYLECHYGESYMELPPEELRRITINKIEY